MDGSWLAFGAVGLMGWAHLRRGSAAYSTEAERHQVLDARGVAVGLGADWSVLAWHLGPGVANRTGGDWYIVEDDEGDHWSVTRRWYVDDNYAGLPQIYGQYADGGNDAIVEVAGFDTFDGLLAWLDAHPEAGTLKR